MRTLKFYGVSDDLFEIEGTSGKEPDEIGCFDRISAVKLTSEFGGLIVVAVYASESGMPDGMPGCWTIGICPLDENESLPGWSMRWRTEGYSTVLEIDVPDDVTVTEVK